MPKGKGIGTALYLELRRDTFTNQLVFFPEFLNPATRKISPVTLMHRQVSKANPKKPWKFRFDSDACQPVRTIDPVEQTIKRDLPFDVAYDAAVSSLAQHDLQFDAILTGDWKLFGRPLGIEYTAVDLQSVARLENPDRFTARLDKARLEAGFGDSLWAEPNA